MTERHREILAFVLRVPELQRGLDELIDFGLDGGARRRAGGAER